MYMHGEEHVPVIAVAIDSNLLISKCKYLYKYNNIIYSVGELFRVHSSYAAITATSRRQNSVKIPPHPAILFRYRHI
jgi:hypothetical protein